MAYYLYFVHRKKQLLQVEVFKLSISNIARHYKQAILTGHPLFLASIFFESANTLSFNFCTKTYNPYKYWL